MINFKKKKRWHCLAGQQPTEMDLKIMEWERKGKLVPTRELVKTLWHSTDIHSNQRL